MPEASFRVLYFFPINNCVLKANFGTPSPVRPLCKFYSCQLQIKSMADFVILNIRPFQNLLLVLVVIFPTRFVKILFFFVSFFRLNRLRPILYSLSDPILSNFKGNIIFMLTSGSHKMPKNLKL